MNLHAKLQQRAAEGKPLRVGMIGAGKFGSMYLSQVPRTPGIHMVGIADLSPARARAALLPSRLSRISGSRARVRSARMGRSFRLRASGARTALRVY